MSMKKNLLAIIADAKTPRERLAVVTLCFLTGKFPYKFKYQMDTWGHGPTMYTLFNQEMNNTGHPCGTVGCIAGLANFMFAKEFHLSSVNSILAASLLGLSYPQKNAIFTPGSGDDGDKLYRELNKHPVQAGRVLYHFMCTGKIDWSPKRRNKPVKIAGRVF